MTADRGEEVNLDDELWTAAHIAKWLHMNVKAVQQRVLCLPGFPRGFRPTKTRRGERRWFQKDVKEWAREAA